MVWAAVGTVAAAAIGGAISADSSRKAAHTQQDAARDSNTLLQDQYNQTVERNKPFVAGGTTAFNSLLDRLGLSGNTDAAGYNSFGKVPTASDVMAEPGYAFGRDQGQLGLDRKLNAHGMSYGGAALAAASKYNNDYATGQYGNAFNRLQSGNQQVYNQLSGVAGMGQQSANNMSAYGAQNAAQQGSNLQGGANASAANSLAQGNAWTNALNQGVSAYKNQQPVTTVGSGQTFFNDPTDAYGKYAVNGSDAGWNPSDIRLKTNIVRIGTTERGNPMYRWDWKTGGSSSGVIAQEVAHIPGAVRADADGLLMVDYTKV
jgi:hypothetical protein